MFVPTKIESYFKNVNLVEHLSFEGKYVYSVKDKYSNESGCLTYYSESNQWDVYVDNFPGNKKYFSTNLPISCISEFHDDMKRTGLELSICENFNFPMYLVGINKEFDCGRNEIVFVVDANDNSKYVKAVFRKSNIRFGFNQATEIGNSYHLLDFMWKEKYGEELPDGFDTYNATTTKALFFGYDGNTNLSEDEILKIKNTTSSFDLTYDIIWFMVESLGWRPSKPVDDADHGWQLIKERFANDDPEGTVNIIKLLFSQNVADAA